MTGQAGQATGRGDGPVFSTTPGVRFGLSWQIVPRRLIELLGDPDPAAATRVRDAMLAMRKIDVAALETAHAGPA
jgi:hypothetical protein